MSKYKNPMDEKSNKVLKETEQQADKPMNKADSFNQANGLEVHKSGKGGGERLKVIGVEEIIKARETLQKYKQQKQSLESRVVNNEEWWKIHNWEQIKKKDAVKADRENPNGIETPSSSAWLFNSITNKIADFSDNYPEANIRARTGGDVPEAERLKNVIPMILKRNKFYKTYIADISEKSKSGTGITYVGWNPKKDGIGDVEIQNINILSIFWQGGITNIQKSRNVFTVELVDTDLLKKQYPSEAENITSDGEVDLKQYLYEDYIDTTDKSLVIDWWYKKDGKLHYCKFVNNVVLFATENEPDEYPNGYYDDGNYPFVFDVMFPMQGIAGFGFIDVGKQPQEYIDKMDAGILQNVLMNSTPRYFERQDSEINEEEFLDWTQPFVKTNTNLGQDDLREINVKGLDSAVFTQRDSKINEIKETTANRDVSTGGTTSGVTAASAISALIETGSKVSRMAIKGTYDAFENIIYLIIERMRQFYDLPRYVRITGDDGTDDFDTYDNSNLKLQKRQTLQGDTAQYLPEFDIEVAAQKASPYSKAAQNELALQLYSAGFFNPQNTDQSLACLNIMDFDHKSDVINQIKKNGTLLDALQQAQMQLQQLQQENEKLKVMCDLNIDNSNLTGMKGKQQGNSPDVAQASTSGSANMESTKPEGMQSVQRGDKGSLAEQAAQKANESAQPR